MSVDLRPRLQAELADRYRLDRELGRGGMAIVFLAHDLKHDRSVALKVLRPELFASLGTGRFLREIKLAASLAHPHIVPLYDSGTAGGLLYYVMPYLTGESLRERLQREGTLPVLDAVRIAGEVANALDYAHRNNIVHRDVKPENILIQDGHAVVSDFGVARAISAAAAWDRASGTGLGIAVGTPDYMSPEQASASTDIDGRSDIYSLGCVLYEMLVGEPPFGGGTAAEQMEAHVADRAPSVSSARRPIPLEIELAVATALSKRPGDRFQSAAAFAAALGDASVTPSGRWPAWLKRRWWAGLAGAAALGALAVAVLPRLLGAGLDAKRYVVVPFGHRAGAAPALLNGDNCELLLYEAFRRWRDVRLSDDLLVHDALQRLGRAPATLADAQSVARRVGAGLLVWGEVAQVGDSILVSAVLYDLLRSGDGAVLRKESLKLGRDETDFGARFDALADSLLLGGVGATPGTVAAAGSTRTGWLAAWRAYAAGHEALGEWNLPRAERAFREAIEIDSAFPDAHLWLAQVREWAGAPPAEWGDLPRAALAAAAPLPAADQARARALLALAEGREPDACAEYERLLARDSLDFSAWYGLAECHRRDRVVVRDAASPSGWRFRGSLETAIRAYSRALRLNPSVHRAFFARLPDLIFIEPSYVRSGRAAAPDTGRFGAWPTLVRDTLAFVPYPLAPFLAGTAGGGVAGSPANARAVARNRQTLREIGRTWVRAFPQSAEAHEALALVLEADGDPAAALAEVRVGRGVAAERLQELRLAVAVVRLLLKRDDFPAARALADSLLAAGGRAPQPAEAAMLAPLAALVGRAGRTAELLASAAPVLPLVTPSGERVEAPAAVAAAGLGLLAHAALGAPPDTIDRLERNLERLVQGSVRPEGRAPVRAALLGIPAVLAFPSAGPRPILREVRDRSYLADLQARFAQGDTAAVRQRLAALTAVRRLAPPGAVAMDGTYNEAWLALGLGDTAGVRARLDATLGALPSLGNALLSQVPQAAALVRAMGLRAELAAGAGDRERAQWWAHAVVVLWSDADPVLQPFVRRMRLVAQSQ